MSQKLGNSYQFVQGITSLSVKIVVAGHCQAELLTKESISASGWGKGGLGVGYLNNCFFALLHKLLMLDINVLRYVIGGDVCNKTS